MLLGEIWIERDVTEVGFAKEFVELGVAKTEYFWVFKHLTNENLRSLLRGDISIKVILKLIL